QKTEQLVQRRERNPGRDTKEPQVDGDVQADDRAQSQGMQEQNQRVAVEEPRFVDPRAERGLFELGENRCHLRMLRTRPPGELGLVAFQEDSMVSLDRLLADE